jgi:Ca-activated chloride channel family protein
VIDFTGFSSGLQAPFTIPFHHARMKALSCSVLAQIIAFGAAAAVQTAVADQPDDVTLSPYFVVKANGETQADALPLKASEADVKIAGVIADVRVRQTYSNAAGTPIEAVYVFPGSTRAAVYGMEMTIGDRVLKARVQKRDEARQTFDKAKSEGRSTSLLEQNRPNVFQMNVANILPGDTIVVELRYTETVIPTAGEYEFVLPAVVGPRYSNQPAAGAPSGERWIQNPYFEKGVRSPASFRIAAELTTGMPIHEINCPSHDVQPEFRDASRAIVHVSGDSAGDRDFILKYRLADSRIESGLILSKGERENFFLLTVQPPRRVPASSLPPREFVFVVDVSGSMNGFPLDTAKSLLRDLLGPLRPEDGFNIVLFASGTALLSPQSLPATPENVSRAIELFGRERGQGGTELLPALQTALNLPRKPESARCVVVITDGFVQAETGAFDIIRQNLDRTSVFAFGIGSSVNRFLIEGMARAGQGEPFVVTRPDFAEREATRFREYISSPVLTHVSIDYGAFDVYDVEPPTIADVLAERPVVVMGKWKGKPAGNVTLRGTTGAGPFEHVIPIAEGAAVDRIDSLGQLWARNRIASLADYNQLANADERVAEVTNLGLTFNLLTAFTSFVAVDTVARPAGGDMLLVKQALPLPHGVENSAVGAAIATTPEPETWMLIGIVALVIGARLWRARKRASA